MALTDAGVLFIADTRNHRIRKVDSAGTITTVAGTGDGGDEGDGGPVTDATLRLPGGLAVGGGALSADTWNHRVRVLSLADQGPPPPTVPEVPLASLLPIAALAVFASSDMVIRRRKV